MISISHVKRYLELGFIVHPCCPPDHHCASPGKIPFDPQVGRHMDGWQDHSQFLMEVWEEWVDLEPEINIGVLAGSPSKIVMIDIDNEEAHGKYRSLQRGRKERPWTFRTGNGLRHIFRHSEGQCISTKLLAGNGCYLEILGDGRQSVVPPSVHPSGREYEWSSGNTPLDYQCSGSPPWCQGGAAGDMDSGETDWQTLLNQNIAEGGRNATLAKLCGHLLAPQPLPPAEVRLWMNAYNKAFCTPPIPDQELNTIIRSISNREEASEGAIRKVMAEYDVNRDVAIEYILQDPDLLDL